MSSFSLSRLKLSNLEMSQNLHNSRPLLGCNVQTNLVVTQQGAPEDVYLGIIPDVASLILHLQQEEHIFFYSITRGLSLSKETTKRKIQKMEKEKENRETLMNERTVLGFKDNEKADITPKEVFQLVITARIDNLRNQGS